MEYLELILPVALLILSFLLKLMIDRNESLKLYEHNDIHDKYIELRK